MTICGLLKNDISIAAKEWDFGPEGITADRTCLMIAHRLSTVRNCDIILVVKGGKIVEQGNHKALLKKKGYYHELYTRQYEDEATAKILA